MQLLKTFATAAALAGATLFTTIAVAESHDKSHADMKTDMVMVGDIHLSGHWIRAMLPGQKVAGGFVTITNKGGAEDRLVSVSTPMAGRAEIHEMSIVDDVMTMRPLADGLPLPAGETVELKPGSYHLMFMAVEEPFKEGGMVPVVLTFEKAGNVELMLPVMPAGTKAMDHGKMKHEQKTN